MGWGGGVLFTCPYPLQVHAHLPRDKIPSFQSRVSVDFLSLITSIYSSMKFYKLVERFLSRVSSTHGN